MGNRSLSWREESSSLSSAGTRSPPHSVFVQVCDVTDFQVVSLVTVVKISNTSDLYFSLFIVQKINNQAGALVDWLDVSHMLETASGRLKGCCQGNKLTDDDDVSSSCSSQLIIDH